MLCFAAVGLQPGLSSWRLLHGAVHCPCAAIASFLQSWISQLLLLLLLRLYDCCESRSVDSHQCPSCDLPRLWWVAHSRILMRNVEEKVFAEVLHASIWKQIVQMSRLIPTTSLDHVHEGGFVKLQPLFLGHCSQRPCCAELG